MQLATIGYEGLDVQSFFTILKNNQVKKLIDIRELPLSRKRGFSKSALAIHAEEFGLGYVHIPELGAPRDVRHEYKDDHDWTRFAARYQAYMKTQVTALDKLSEVISAETCCLLCFEADHTRCHRRFVASAMYARFDGEVQVNHLAAPEKAPAAWLQPLVGIALPQ
jgi:uncharacterized protein (DUF488 family)